jgi:hypothetical protein
VEGDMEIINGQETSFQQVEKLEDCSEELGRAVAGVSIPSSVTGTGVWACERQRVDDALCRGIHPDRAAKLQGGAPERRSKLDLDGVSHVSQSSGGMPCQDGSAVQPSEVY